VIVFQLGPERGASFGARSRKLHARVRLARPRHQGPRLVSRPKMATTLDRTQVGSPPRLTALPLAPLARIDAGRLPCGWARQESPHGSASVLTGSIAEFQDVREGMNRLSAALTAPAVARNREPILAVLRNVLPTRGKVLEIASGTGEHAVHFARALPGLTWQPSDRDPQALRSIAAHRDQHQLPNILEPVELDVTASIWPVDLADAVVAINMIHIAPWQATEGLMQGATRILPQGSPLFLYGPFKEGGEHTAPSNMAFDADLRSRNPDWGVRDLGDVCELASAHGFAFIERVPMPANNLSVVFRRRVDVR
jgi:uncharacterized protein DUF938